MKRHLLGFAIFSFIFASFAVAFARVYVQEIPSISEVNQQPVYHSEIKTSCWKKSKQSKNIQYEVISSQYFYGENEVVSKIKLTWKGDGNVPKKINVVAKFSSTGNSSKVTVENSQFFESPLSDSNSSFIKVVSKLGVKDRFDRKKNLYAHFTIFDENSETNNPKTFASLSPTPVVFVHNGDSGFGYSSGSGSGNPER